MPRFQADNYAANLQLLSGFEALALEAGCSMAQLALAWVLAQGEHVVALPGTTRLSHLEEDLGAAAVSLSPDIVRRAAQLIHRGNVSGARYSAATQTEIDTEEF
jgi:aryl-alcohol dehydrogenase-like predicted oxidoreductase